MERLTPVIRPEDENDKLGQLKRAEERIESLFRRGVECTRALAREFNLIREKQLYTARGYTKFEPYASELLKVNMDGVNRWNRIAWAADEIEAAGLPLPANESQLEELSSLEPEEVTGIWQDILQTAKNKATELTADIVRDVVEDFKSRRPRARKRIASRKRAGVMVNLKLDGSKELSFSENAQKALRRIGKICGADVAQVLREGNPRISDTELIRWADQNDDLVRALTHYVIFKRWKVGKAVRFEDKKINRDTSIDTLENLALARGGLVIITHVNERMNNQRFQIRIENVTRES